MNLQLVTYLLGFKPTRQNNKTIQPTLRAVYFSIRICCENALKYYKFPTNSSTNLACAQKQRNNNLLHFMRKKEE